MRRTYILSVLSFLTNSVCVHSQPSDFYDMCARGWYEKLEKYIKEDPSIVNIPTEDGETCLHLVSINKSLSSAELLIKNGADVNARTTHAEGLRMTPLAWHTFAGNYEIVKLLLENGADINLDFDEKADGTFYKITVTDVAVDMVVRVTDSRAGDFEKIYKLFVDSGGKPYKEIQKEHDEL